MALSSKRREAITQLLRKDYKKDLSKLVRVGCRYSSEKWSCYELLLDTESGHTIYVNLDADPITFTVSDKPSKLHMQRYTAKIKRQEERIARKKAREEKAAVRKTEKKEAELHR